MQKISCSCSTAYEAGRAVKTGPGRLLSVSGYNSKGSAQFIHIYDSAAVPSDAEAEESTCDLGTRTAAQLADKYFTISSPAVDYYVWFNLDSGGVDPDPDGKTAIAVAISTGESTDTMATAAAAAIDALDDFVSTATGAVITITNAEAGEATDIGTGTLTEGVTVEVTTQGINATAPLATLSAAASSNFTFPLPVDGFPISNGIAVSNSSTGPTHTAGSDDCFFTAVYTNTQP